MTATTPIEATNEVVAKLYFRLDEGGDLRGKLSDLMSDVNGEIMREVGVAWNEDEPHGWDPAATELFGDNKRALAQIAGEIVEHYRRATRKYLEGKAGLRYMPLP